MLLFVRPYWPWRRCHSQGPDRGEPSYHSVSHLGPLTSCPTHRARCKAQAQLIFPSFPWNHSNYPIQHLLTLLHVFLPEETQIKVLPVPLTPGWPWFILCPPPPTGEFLLLTDTTLSNIIFWMATESWCVDLTWLQILCEYSPFQFSPFINLSPTPILRPGPYFMYYGSNSLIYPHCYWLKQALLTSLL